MVPGADPAAAARPVEPSLSVVMATYNGARFVEEQVRSVLAQDRAPDELIVADDGSTDGTVALVERLLAGAPFPWRLGVNPTRLGPAGNFAALFRLARGDVIVPCDQDDRWAPDKLRRIADHLSAHGCDIVVHDAHLVGADGRRRRGTLWSRIPFPDAERRAVGTGDALRVLLRHNVVTGAAMGFRSGLLRALEPFPETGMHDYTLALAAAVAGRICLIDEPVGEYRLHGANAAGVWSAWRIPDLCRRTGATDRAGVLHLEQVAERLERAGMLDERTSRAMHERVDFLRYRAALPRSFPARARLVVREWARHDGYRSFASGTLSVARDLALGSPR